MRGSVVTMVDMRLVDARPQHEPVDPLMTPPVVDVVIPVYNEERVLDASIDRLCAYLGAHLPYSWRVTIVDNASTDGTWQRAETLAALRPGVRALRVDRKGRGLALRTAWSQSDAAVLAYMDVDLSTGLDAILPLVAPLVSGHSDVAIGSRLASGAAVARGPKREIISRAYNVVLRAVFAVRFHDAQCGFKAIRSDVAARLLPEIRDDAWFFDTELLLLAEYNGLRIHEVPVDWIDDPDSRVKIASTAFEDLKGVARVGRRFATGHGRIDLAGATRPVLAQDMGRQFVSFGLIGLCSTIVSLALYLLWREPLGALQADISALSVTMLGNTWANRRYTLTRRGAIGRWRDYARGIATFVFAVALSSATLLVVTSLNGGLLAEMFGLAASWAIAATVRFDLLRRAARLPSDAQMSMDRELQENPS